MRCLDVSAILCFSEVIALAAVSLCSPVTSKRSNLFMHLSQ